MMLNQYAFCNIGGAQPFMYPCLHNYCSCGGMLAMRAHVCKVQTHFNYNNNTTCTSARHSGIIHSVAAAAVADLPAIQVDEQINKLISKIYSLLLHLHDCDNAFHECNQQPLSQSGTQIEWNMIHWMSCTNQPLFYCILYYICSSSANWK